MNVFRLTAIAFSLILFSACGGGGGGGGSAGGGGVTPPPPPPALEPLPAPLITNAQQAADATGGNLSNETSGEIEAILGSRAETGTLLLSSDIINLSPDTRDDEKNIPVNCGGTECSAEDIGAEFSLNDFGDTPQFGGRGEELTRYQEEYSAVMTKTGVSFAQFRAAGRANNGVTSQYRNYGGWLTESAFAVHIQEAGEAGTAGGNTATLLFSQSFGNASGTDPDPALDAATWNGVMVGATEESEVVQGDVAIVADFSNPNDLKVEVGFTGIKNFDTGEDITLMPWESLNIISGGTFSATDGSIEGTFYGEAHEEVGGVFDRDSIVGAFGAAR